MSTAEEEIDIAAWIEQEITALRCFQAFWKGGMATDPEHWPERMPAGEWDEQYRAYSDAMQEPEA